MNKRSRSDIQKLMEEMEADGIIMRTGEFRPDSKGEPQPVYVVTELGKALEAARRSGGGA